MNDTKKLKIKTFHGLLQRLCLMSYKEDMLSGYGVESTRDLEEFELDELIGRLREQERSRHQEHEAELRGLKSVSLTILQRMGIYQNNRDWNQVNQFLLNPRVAGKLLYELNADELRALNKKLRGIERKKALERERIQYQKLNN